jgi:hypothetical protein
MIDRDCCATYVSIYSLGDRDGIVGLRAIVIALLPSSLIPLLLGDSASSVEIAVGSLSGWGNGCLQVCCTSARRGDTDVDRSTDVYAACSYVDMCRALASPRHLRAPPVSYSTPSVDRERKATVPRTTVLMNHAADFFLNSGRGLEDPRFCIIKVAGTKFCKKPLIQHSH